MQAEGRIHRQSIIEQQKGPMAAIGDGRWSWNLPSPSDYAKRRCLCLPCLWLCMRSSSHKRTTQNIPTTHPAPPTTPPALSPLFSLSLSSLGCCCHHHQHHRPAALPVPGYCSHPTRSFPPRRHSPTTTPALLSAALRHLCTSSLGRQTNRQTDGQTVSQTDNKSATQKARKHKVTKSLGLRDAAACVLQYPLQHHPAVSTC
jgi:hypothetical protein